MYPISKKKRYNCYGITLLCKLLNVCKSITMDVDG